MNKQTVDAGTLMIKALAANRNNALGAEAWVAGQPRIERDAVVEQLKAAIGAQDLDAFGSENTGVSRALLARLAPLSLVGRMTRARRVPSRTRIVSFGSGVAATSLPEGAPIPASKSSLAGVFLEHLRVAGLVVVSDELARLSGPEAEAALANDLLGAVGLAEDDELLNTSRGILAGVTGTASAGTSLANVDTDLGAAIASLVAGGGSLETAVWVMSPTTASALSRLRGTGGAPAYPAIGPKGGELLGLPVLTSQRAAGKIVLVDEGRVLITSDDSARVELSANASLQLLDDPTNNSVAPTATTQVSCFQTNTVAVRGTLHRGFYAQPGSAAFISGVAY